MPVNSIIYQPATAQLLAAYRPIVFKVQATATGGGPIPPYVVCDIYLADLYYKSIIRTAPESFTNLLSVFSFDIADALQEYLQPDIAVIDNSNLLQAPHMSAKVFCRFRSSDIDADGFTVEEGTKPVQGTKFTSPVSGTGLQSNTFFAINSALQHEDNQNLANHLNTFKQGAWAANAHPLTHRNKYFFCPGDSDHFPVIFTGECISADLILNYRLKGSAIFQQAIAGDLHACESIEYNIDITGNNVQVALLAALESGETVLVQYKKQADSVWIDAGSFTAQTFSFNVNGDDIAGDYDIRIIHFCSACLSSDPVLDEFTLDGTVINTAWRGYLAYCQNQDVDPPVYVVLEVRNEITVDTFYPDAINPENKHTVTTGNLYAKFYSDAAHLTPYTLVQNNVKIFVKQIQAEEQFTGSNTYNRVYETVLTFTKNVNGVEILLDAAITENNTELYSTYPTVASYTNSSYTFTPYPTHALTGGHTGYLGYASLEQYNTDTNTPTGNYKLNEESDPDYIAPFEDARCASGPDLVLVTYGYSLEISKVELSFNSQFVYAPTIANTGVGGYQYALPVPRDAYVNISVKAKTLDSGNTSNLVYVRIGYMDSSGNYQTAAYGIPNNVEIGIPQTFFHLVNINISNY